jgi:hypothetical protein
MSIRSDTCESLRRLNERYRDAIERLTRERDELRQIETVLGELLTERVAGSGDVQRRTVGRGALGRRQGNLAGRNDKPI